MTEFYVLTPYGVVAVTFGGDDDNNTYYRGDDDVVMWLKEAIKQCTDGNGASIDPDTVDPDTLVGFCNTESIKVFPPLEYFGVQD